MESYTFTSSDQTQINAYRWTPSKPPIAIVHISHGMGEHAARYDWTAQKLSEAGFLVTANDHRGHGKTAEVLGDFGENGWQKMVSDLSEMIQENIASNPGLPVVLFGHSMGSMLSEHFVTLYAKHIDLLVLSGSPGFSPKPLVWISRMLCRFENWRLGPRKESNLLNFLIFGSANKDFENEGDTGFEWLCRDESEVAKYATDPMCGFVPFPSSLSGMFDGVKYMQDKANIKEIPSDLPIYMFSGTADPVHNDMANIERLISAWKNHNLTIDSCFYEGGRHETLNETNKEEVIQNLITWLLQTANKISKKE
ncbi:MAG: alpha-beta hydrolase superfamily lysophospholipase [Flavobacterium sp.]|jgi:alpha-beta hydrolase superfamily lysophospholipase